MSIALPKGWASATVAQIAEVIGGLTKNAKRERLTKKRPYLRVANVYTNRLDLTEVLTIGVEDSELERVSLRPGDMLVVEGNGSPDQIGRVALWKGEIPKAVHQNHIIKVRFRDCVDATFALWWFIGPQGRAFIQDVASSTSGLFTLSISKIQALPLPIAPIREQQRIVAAIDERLSELDASVAFLERAERNLVRYRAAVLAAACSGKLVPTEAALARCAGRSYESAAEQVRLTKTPPRPHRFESRTGDVIPGHPALCVGDPGTPVPEGWLWTPLVSIARMESGHTPSRRHPEWWGGSIPWIGIVDAREHHGVTIHRTIECTNEQGLANSAARLLPTGTVCISRTASVGYVVTMGKPMATSQDFVNWTPTEAVTSDWLRIVFLTDREAIRRFGKGSVHKTVYYPEWLSMHIALPPLAEQVRIVAEVERHLSRADALASSIAQSKRRAQRLRRAILAAAFQGRLVSQDPNDEPASVLLDRVRAQAATAEAASAATPRRGRPLAQPATPVASASPPAMTTKRRGRPPGSKNKIVAVQTPKRRGRPPGSKNRPKT